MATKKPKLELGEFGPVVEVVYSDAKQPAFNGTYKVELGAEYKHRGDNKTRRSVRVNGRKTNIYAMVRTTFANDRKILRDEAELQIRAIEWHIAEKLKPELEQRQEADKAARYAAALASPDSWMVIEDTKRGRISIQPLNFDLHYSTLEPNEADRLQKKMIINRIVGLMQRYGLKD